jgi:tetratricopeptide (TPR) repeat protein
LRATTRGLADRPGPPPTEHKASPPARSPESAPASTSRGSAQPPTPPEGLPRPRDREKLPRPAPRLPRADGDKVYELSAMAVDLDDILRDDGEAAASSDPAVVEIDLTEALSRLAISDEEAVAALTGGPVAAVEIVSPAVAPPAVDGPETASGLDTVFQEFRDEVARQSDSEGNRQLVIAKRYLDLGMAAEAEKVLEAVVRAPACRFEAALLLGGLARDRGSLQAAIDWFERAADGYAPSADQLRALLWALGETLEEAGEQARALAVFLELASDDPDDREVRARVERLSQEQTRDQGFPR